MRPQNEMNKKIADAFYTVLKNTAFAKAKVTTITKAAGISHQTFYRYYMEGNCYFNTQFHKKLSCVF